MAYDLLQWGKFLFHICHDSNLPTILKRGIYSKNELKRLRIKYTSIADEGIQNRRRTKSVTVGPKGGCIHDYVPLFFAARPPMLYPVCARYPEEEIVYLLVRWQLLEADNTVFTDGNASTFGTKFYCGVDNLNILDHKALRATQWGGANNTEIRRRKSAEVLVWNHLPPDHLVALIVKNEETKNRVERIVAAQDTSLQVYCAPEYYYK
jgi:hypothetical protein